MSGVFTLNLGVADVPYTQGPIAPRRAVVRRHKSGVVRSHMAAASGQQTTGDVAQILEEKYNILESFSREYEGEIVDALAHSIAVAIDNVISGAPVPANPFLSAESEIEQAMKLYLDLQQMDGANGVPTKAAERGVNHRMAHPYARRAARPSFIDTGLMQANYRAWTEES